MPSVMVGRITCRGDPHSATEKQQRKKAPRVIRPGAFVNRRKKSQRNTDAEREEKRGRAERE